HLDVHVVRMLLVLVLLFLFLVVMLVRAVGNAIARIEVAVAGADMRGAKAPAQPGRQVPGPRIRVVEIAEGRRDVAGAAHAALQPRRPWADRHDTEAAQRSPGVDALPLRDQRTMVVVRHDPRDFLAHDVHDTAERTA